MSIEKKDYSLVSGLWTGQFNHNMAFTCNQWCIWEMEKNRWKKTNVCHHWGTLEQDTKLTNVHMGPCNELATESGIPCFTHMQMDSNQHTPLDPERNRENRDFCKMEPKASDPAREVKGIAVGSGIEYTTDIGDSHDISMCDQTTKHKPVFARSGEAILLCVTCGRFISQGFPTAPCIHKRQLKCVWGGGGGIRSVSLR